MSSALEAVAVLGDDLRRRLYDHVRRSPAPVTRDEAARDAGISRKLAAFHLDKLVAVGLLSVSYARPAGLRRAGRTPKVYAPAETSLQISIPPREHGLLAGILLRAVRHQAPGESGTDAALRSAASHGRSLGAADRDRLRPGRLGPERALTYVADLLERHGFEPARDAPTRMSLRNCPFHPMAADDPDLVCAINHAFVSGLLDGLGATTLDAILAPRPGNCCVTLAARPPSP